MPALALMNYKKVPPNFHVHTIADVVDIVMVVSCPDIPFRESQHIGSACSAEGAGFYDANFP
jgi:hypothetical protein